MKQYDGPQSDHQDGDLLWRIQDHAAVVEGAVPPISGADVRRSVDATATSPTDAPATVPATTADSTSSSRANRGRAPFLAAAAAVVIAVGAGAFALNRSSDSEPLEVNPAAETIEADDGDEADEVDDGVQAATVDDLEQDPTDEPVDEVEQEPTAGVPDLRPEQVKAADFGADEIRYLPSSDSGFVVSSGSQVLLSEADLSPEAATPIRWQRVSLPATDQTDRRSILVHVTTYVDGAAADALIEAEPTSHGVAGEPMDVAGRLGAWHQVEGFAPFSAGNPMRVIGVARVRLGSASVLDVAATDVPRAEIEQFIASITLTGDGSLEPPVAPVGFDSAEVIDGVSPVETRSRPSASDYLSLTLVGESGEQVELSVSLEPIDSDETTAHFVTPTGYGWIEHGLFRETIVTFVGANAAFIFANYDGQVAADELITIAESMELVDSEAWVERLAIAPLFKAPVGGVPVGD